MSETTDWLIRKAYRTTRGSVKAFAYKNDISIPEALKRLVEAGEKALEAK